MNIFIDTQDSEERYAEELYKEYLENENKKYKNILTELEEWLKVQDSWHILDKIQQLKEKYK